MFRRRKLAARGQRKVRCAAGLVCEPLEGRMLLSTFVWTNRGSDNFGIYGANATVARTIVDRALGDWGRVIANFNYGSNKFNLEINGYTWDDGMRGETYDITFNSDKKPTSAKIRLDNDGGGNGWYFDPTIGTAALPDDSEFDDIWTAFTAEGPAGGNDFYRTVVHEIGHAVGILVHSGSALYGYLTNTGVADPHDADARLYTFNVGGGAIEATFTSNGGGHFYEGPAIAGHPEWPTHPNDLMNAGRTVGPPPRRQLITDLIAGTLRDAYGYTIAYPSQINTFFANLNTTTRELVVRGDPNDPDNQIFLTMSGTAIRVQVAGCTEDFPSAEVSTIVVHAGDGDDLIYLDNLPSTVSVTVNAGDGNDRIYFGNGDIDTNIDCNVTINGGAGNDTLTLDDKSDVNDDTYWLYSGSFDKTGFGLLTFGTIEDIVLEANAYNNTVYVQGVASGVRVAVRGGDGNDSIYVGNGDLDRYIGGDVSVSGGNGSDTVYFDDAADTGDDTYTFAVNYLIKAYVTPMAFSLIEGIRLDAGTGHNVIYLDELLSGRPATLYGGAGNDTIRVGGGSLASKILSNVTVYGQDGDDKLVINDADSSGGDSYTLASTTFTKTGFGTLSYFTTERCELSANGSGNYIYINSFSGGGMLDIYAGAGNDNIYIGNGDIDTNINADVNILGGNGNDRLYLEDAADTGNDTYTFNPSGFTKTGFGILTCASVEYVSLDANSANNVINLNYLAPGTNATVNGNDGNDTIYAANGDLDTNLDCYITLSGGNGTDVLTIDDNADVGNDTYTMTGTAVSKPSGGSIGYSALEALTLIANSYANTIKVDSTIAATPVTVSAGAGNDTVDVGNGDLDNNIDGAVSIDGGGGADAVNLNDAADTGNDTYTITAATFTKPGAAAVSYLAVESLTLNANNAVNTVYVNSVSAATPVTVNAGDGDDTVVVGGGDIDTNIAAGVTVVGGNGADTLRLDDVADSGNDGYTVARTSVAKAGTPPTGFATVETVTLEANWDANTIDVLEVSSGVSVRILAGGGSDIVTLSPVDNDLDDIAGSVYVDGGDGYDAVTLRDDGLAFDDPYTITSTAVTRAYFGGLTYTNTEEINLYGQSGNNIVKVNSTSAAGAVRVYAGGGNDEMRLAESSRNLGSIGGPVTFNGGSGADTLTLYDDAAALGSTYTISASTILRGGFGGVGFGLVENIKLLGQTNANKFDISGTPPGAALTLDGGGGADTFCVNGKISGPLSIDGNLPAASPGDTLYITGAAGSTGTYTPSASTPGAGVVVFDGQTIVFAGLENDAGAVNVASFKGFAMVTPRAVDKLIIDGGPVAGSNRISGTSGGVTIAPLSFTGVAGFVLDCATGEAGAGADDDVRIQPPGLVATGLSSFRFAGGTGEDALTVNAGELTFGQDAVLDTAALYLYVNTDGVDKARVTFQASQHLAGLKVGDGGTATLAQRGSRVIVLSSLSIGSAGLLDLSDNDMVVRATASSADNVLDTVSGYVASARNSGGVLWTGYGLTSSAAAANPMGTTGLAVIRNLAADGDVVHSAFAGESVDTACILVKYTYNGDANVDGRVDADDYFRIDQGFLNAMMRYRQGDFDYVPLINADDYYLIDVAFLRQAAPLKLYAAAPGPSPAGAAPSAEPTSRREDWPAGLL